MLTTALAAIASLVLAPPRHVMGLLQGRASARSQERIEAAAAAVLATEPLRCGNGAER